MAMDDGHYAPPLSEQADARGPESVKRPVSPMVFGILAIIFGSLGVLGAPMNFIQQDPQQLEIQAKMGYSPGFSMVLGVFNLLMAVWLLTAGIGLVRYRAWGRKAFVIYAWVTIVSVVASGIWIGIHLSGADFNNDIERFAMIGAMIGVVLGLVFPVLGLIFLTRQRVLAAFDGPWSNTPLDDRTPD